MYEDYGWDDHYSDREDGTICLTDPEHDEGYRDYWEKKFGKLSMTDTVMVSTLC